MSSRRASSRRVFWPPLSWPRRVTGVEPGQAERPEQLLGLDCRAGQAGEGAVVLGLQSQVCRALHEGSGQRGDVAFRLVRRGERFLQAKLRVEVESLGQVAEAQLGAGVGHAAGIGQFQPGQDAQQGGLPAAVRTDQAQAFPGRDAEGDIAEYGLEAVGLADMVCREHGRSCRK